MSDAERSGEHKGRILIVDDTPDNLRLLMRMLTEQGYAAHPATEGELALRFAQATLPDLILLDVIMPGMDGYQVCERLKAIESTRDIPVIFISAADQVLDKVKAFRSGGVDYIVKPFEVEEVVARIKMHLSLRNLQKHLEERVAERTAELSQANASLNAANVRLNEEITERKQAEEELRKSAEEISDLYNHAPCGYHSLDRSGTFIRINDTELNWLGYTRDEIVGKLSIADITSPGDLKIFRENFFDLVEREQLHDVELVMIRKDGTKMPVLLRTTAERDHTGNVTATNSTTFDITERKQLEVELQQSQKMEAVGRLAGGIAHDFNNMLTAISGYADLILRQSREEDPVRHKVEEIKKASTRAATLIYQLLAFSRKQILQPKTLDLNEIVSDMDKMLQRMIGEDIQLTTSLDPLLGNVKADPGQISQVIMNLAINSRDAMPAGGVLTIETANVVLDQESVNRHVSATCGTYVMLAVSDTGTGMDAETRKQIFDPFFTTKEVGKGTGLGLSTVYGIVKQSGGNIWVYSEVGKGTTFKIYLPRIEDEADVIEAATASPDFPQGTENILLVEDEEMVRTLARQILETCGYQVTEATNGAEAIAISEQGDRAMDLLVTDVVMPQMSGRELANRLMASHPHLRVLYMSGYTDTAIVQHGILDTGTHFIQKPFPPEALAKKVREVLDVS